MVLKDLKSKAKSSKAKDKKDNEESDEDFYDFTRGKSSMVVQRVDGDEDYRPQRRIILMMSSDESEDSDYIPKRSPEDKDKNTRMDESKPSKNESSEVLELKKENQDDKNNQSSASVPSQWTFRSSEEWANLLGAPAWQSTHNLIRQVRGSIERQNENISDMTSNLAQLKSDMARDEKNRKEDVARRELNEKKLREALLDVEDHGEQMEIKLACCW
jgi:hypothetical protein